VRLTRRSLAVALLTMVLAGAGAYAYNTAGGSGAGSAPTGTMLPVTITALTGGDVNSSSLVPGGSSDVIVRVDNPNTVPVQVLSIEPAGAIYADAAFPGCTTTGVSFNAPSSPVTPSVTVGAGTRVLVHLEGAASMDFTSSQGCQGATFHIPVTLTARQ
jgi:hypothetical protein